MGGSTNGARRTLAIRLSMGLGTAGEAVALDATGKAAPFRDPDDVDVIANLKHIGAYGLAWLDFIILSKRYFSQVSQRGQVVAIQMAFLAAGQFSPVNFPEAQLGSAIPVPLKRLHLSDVAGPGFDHCHCDSLAPLVEYLRHTNFLA
jgi:hypothetical protein